MKPAKEAFQKLFCHQDGVVINCTKKHIVFFTVGPYFVIAFFLFITRFSILVQTHLQNFISSSTQPKSKFKNLLFSNINFKNKLKNKELPNSWAEKKRNQISDDHCVENLARENARPTNFGKTDTITIRFLHNRNTSFRVDKFPFPKSNKHKERYVKTNCVESIFFLLTLELVVRGD